MSASSPNNPSHPRLTLVRSELRTDGELCRAFVKGDPGAFGELVARYQETVYRVVRRYAQDHNETIDLAQLAFLQAFQAARRTIPRLDRAASAQTGEVPFKAWLLRIAINLAKNHARHNRRWKMSPLESVQRMASERDVSAQAALEKAEAEAMTRHAVLNLPKRQREVFTLRIDAGLSFADVGRTLGITEANAKTHFHYAVRRLREEVQALLSAEGFR